MTLGQYAAIPPSYNHKYMYNVSLLLPEQICLVLTPEYFLILIYIYICVCVCV